MPANIYDESLALHKKLRGKIAIKGLINVKTSRELSMVYTPGIAAPVRAIVEDPSRSFDLTWRGRTVAIISDGSAVLGLGNIGPEAALPVMEGKAMLMKEFGGVDAVPVVINTQDPVEIIHFVKTIAPSFAGINLEDISAPRCFQIEEALQDIGIPVFHDDQHATAIVIAAALRNAAKVIDKAYKSLKVIIIGAGAAGLATARILLGLNCSSDICERIPGISSIKDVILVDSHGALYAGRENQNIYKQAIAGITNSSHITGSLQDALKNADAVIGLSQPNLLSQPMIKSMADKPIVFALANPSPEIRPDAAKAAGADIVATGRSDYPNQINNISVFPGIFRAVIKGRLKVITNPMKMAAVYTLAGIIKNPSEDNIIPSPMHPGLADTIAKAVIKAK